MDKNIKKKWGKFLVNSINNKKVKSIKNTVLLVDGLNLFLRAFSVVPTTNEMGIHNGGIFGSLNSLRFAIKMLQPSRCIVVFDGKGGSQRRRKLYSEYKNNRRGMKNVNRTFKWNSEEQEEQSCFDQLNRFLDYLELLPVTTITVDNIEADDTIAYACTNIFDKETDCIIMSSDKDFLQLVNDNVKVWSPTKKKLYTKEKIKEEYGIYPSNIIFWRALDGDKSDNIPGIDGIGRKTVLKLFNEIIEEDKKIKFNEFLDYIDYLYENNNTSKKIINLYENKDIIDRNYKLMQLYDVDISGTSKSIIMDVINNKKISPLNQTKLRMLFLKDKLYSQIKNFSSWYSTFFSLNLEAIKFNKSLIK